MRDRLGTVPTFNSCTKCVGSPGMIHDRTPDCYHELPKHGCMDDLTIERSFVMEATWVIDVLFVDMLSMDVFTTRFLQTSG